MTIEQQKNNKWSYIWLVLGSALMSFSNWNWSIPVAIWLFPIFFLRYSHSQKLVTGMFAICSASVIIGLASMWKLLSIDAIPSSFRVASGLAVGIIFFLPFLADRILAAKLPGFLATLIFPCSWVALEYCKSLGNGSWGGLAYTQYGNLPLLQLASITGIWGLSFLITWFASMVNFAWEREFSWSKIRKTTILYGLIISFVFLYGYGRLALSDEPTDKVCIGSVTNPRDFVARFYKPDWTDRKSANTSMQKDLEYLFDATRNSAQAGAQIVFWQEYAVSVMEENEQEFMARAKKLAQEEQIYLALAIALFPLNFPDQPWQNKLIWITPDGNVIGEYFKLKPAPPLEPIVPGEGGILIVDTVYGKIASVICADLDYPSLIRQSGAAGAGILLIPAQSWPAVDPLHTHMAVMRAVENGLSVFMGTGGGLSIAVDDYGRTINASDYLNSPQKQMNACLPARGVATLYSRIGDTFAWLCILFFVLLIVWSICFERR